MSVRRSRVGPKEWTPEWLSYSPLLDHAPLQALWRWTFCKLNVHLFDQVASERGTRLYCDACGCELQLRRGRILHDDAEE